MARRFAGTGPAASAIDNGVDSNAKNVDYLMDLELKRVPFPRAECPFNVPPHVLDRCGVTADEVLVGPADPNMYQSISGSNRVEQIRAAYGPKARVVVDPETKQQLYYGTGNVCMAVPRVAYEAAQERYIDAPSREFQKDLEDSDEPNAVESTEVPDRSDMNYFRRQAANNSRSWRDSGMVGQESDTYQMTLDEGMRRLKALGKDPEVMAAEHRRGAIHAPIDAEHWRNMIGGKKTFGVGNTGFTNQNSALAQARRAKA